MKVKVVYEIDKLNGFNKSRFPNFFSYDFESKQLLVLRLLSWRLALVLWTKETRFNHVSGLSSSR